MFLLEPNETAWDLRWRMFGIPVRVHPMFWLLAAMLGWGFAKVGIVYLALWIGCVFVSILVHELGHALTGMAFGASGRIVLYAFGGMVINSNQIPVRWQRITVCAAGPIAGFLLLACVLGFLWARDPDLARGQWLFFIADLGLPASVDPDVMDRLREQYRDHRLQFYLVEDLIFINLLWGVLNLLPIWPLDGGQITRDVCESVSPAGGLKFSLGLSLVTAGLLCINSIMAMNGRPFLPLKTGSLWSTIFFGMFAVQSFQLLQQAHAQERWREQHWDHDDR